MHTAIYSPNRNKNQRQSLEDWAAAHDQNAKWFRDWQRIEADKDVSCVVVWCLSQLGTSNGLATILDDLSSRQIKLISLKEKFDLNTPAGRQAAQVLASIAQDDAEIRSKRVRAGQKAAKAAGVQWGGRQLGCRIKLSVEKENTIRSMFKAGEKVADIAKATELTRQTIYSWIKRQQ